MKKPLSTKNFQNREKLALKNTFFQTKLGLVGPEAIILK